MSSNVCRGQESLSDRSLSLLSRATLYNTQLFKNFLSVRSKVVEQTLGHKISVLGSQLRGGQVKTALQSCPPFFFHCFAPPSNEVSREHAALVRRFIPSSSSSPPPPLSLASLLDAVTRLRVANFSISRQKFTAVIVDDLFRGTRETGQFYPHAKI